MWSQNRNLLTRILRKDGGGVDSVNSELPTWQETELEKTYLLLVKNSWNRAKEWVPSVIVVVVSFNIKILWQTIKDIL